MLIRTSLFIIIAFFSLTNPPVVFVVLAGLYALRYNAYELLLLAASIDAFYGSYHPFVPYYTIGVVAYLFVLEWLKPRLSVYNQ